MLSSAVGALMGKKAMSTVILDMRGLVSYTDFLIISTGESEAQVKAAAEEVLLSLKKDGFPVFQVEGLEDAGWVLIDCGVMVVHILLPDLRSFYDLEGLWADAPLEEITETFE